MKVRKCESVVYGLFLSIILISGCSISPEEARDKGFQLYDSNRKQKAYSYLEKAYSGGIDDPELCVRLSFCRIAIDNDPSGGIEILRDSALRYPDYAPTYDQLGKIALKFGPNENNANLYQAIYFARKAVETDPSEWRYKDNLGAYLYLVGEPDSALVWFKAAWELNPVDPEFEERIRHIEGVLGK